MMKTSMLMVVSAFTASLGFCASVYPTAAGDRVDFDGQADVTVQAPLATPAPAAGAYVRVKFKAAATQPCRLQGVHSLMGGKECPSNWDLVYPAEAPSAYDRVFFVYPGADRLTLAVQSMMTLKGLSVETATVEDACRYSDAVWAEANKGDILKQVLADYPVPARPFAGLPRLRAALTNGKPLKVHFLGDSISQDMYFSLFQAQIKKMYPKSDLSFTLYIEGSTGCSVYKDKFETAVAAYMPDVLVICGLDNFRGNGYKGPAAAAAALEAVIGRAQAMGCEVLYITPAHSADSRLLKNGDQLWGQLPWGSACAAAKFDPAAGDFWTKDCYAPVVRNEVLNRMKVACWDLYPQNYDFIERSGRPYGWFNRDALHNNERGRAVIAHLLMAYFEKANAN